MEKASWYFYRLRSMNYVEILWRIRTTLRDYFDLVTGRTGLNLPATIRTRHLNLGTQIPIVCQGDRKSAWKGLDENVKSTWESRLVEKAENILVNRLTYFGLENLHHGSPFNWHRDWSSGIDAPVRHVTLTDYRDFNTFGDCKMVWEPNRHYQLVVLGRAYIVTGDKKYADKAVALMLAWIDGNPFGYGMNWKSPLELGIRLINWVWTADMIRASGAISDSNWQPIARAIYLMMWDIQRKFSRGSSANNHLIGEAAGVFIAASYFPDWPNARVWRDTSKAILEKEILSQTYPDGCTREHAFGYQYFVLQFFSLCYLTAKLNDNDFSSGFGSRLHAMYSFLKDLCADTGTAPDMGDSDEGYVLDLGELPEDGEQLLGIGAYLFDDADLASSKPSESAFWLFGCASILKSGSESARASRAYPDSGYCILRGHDGGSDVPALSVFFDCAELGYGPIAAHGHADCLGFTLNIGAQRVLRDAGTYDYFSFPEWRQYFRTTAAHNTVEIDGVCQSVSLGPFLWGKRAKANLLAWHDNSRVSTVTGEHDGYLRLPDPVGHRRTLELHKRDGVLLVTDQLTAGAEHIATLHFHVDPDCQVKKLSDNAARLWNNDFGVNVECDSGMLSIIAASPDTKTGWISDGYHRKEPSHCIVISLPFDSDTKVITRISVEH